MTWDAPLNIKIRRAQDLAHAVIRQAMIDLVTTHEIITGKRRSTINSPKDDWCKPWCGDMDPDDRDEFIKAFASVHHDRAKRFLMGQGECHDTAALWFSIADIEFFTTAHIERIKENGSEAFYRLAKE